MSSFLTVKEAAERTGKSSSSIRRVIYPIVKDDRHPDRSHIQPSPEDALKLRMKGENFPWLISEELLQRAVPMETTSEKEGSATSSRDGTDAHSELISMLQAELTIKNQQISQQSEMLSRQMELISGLSERLREGNVLIGSLQQQLTLPETSTRTKPFVVDADTSKQAAGPSAAKSTGKTPKAAKPKRGFFGRLFR
jgi:hypothetical protein